MDPAMRWPASLAFSQRTDGDTARTEGAVHRFFLALLTARLHGDSTFFREASKIGILQNPSFGHLVFPAVGIKLEDGFVIRDWL